MSEQSNRFGDLLRALSMLTEALGKSANIQTVTSRSARPPDISVDVFLRDQRHHPRLTFVLFQDAESAAKSSSNEFVLVANRVTSQTAAAWRNKGQSFIDLGGTVYIEVPGLLVDKKVRRQLIATKAQSKSVDPFADRASRISRYLLNHQPGQSWGIRELASLTQISLGTASKIVRTLEDRDLVVVAHEGRRAAVSVKNPRLLFKSWTSSYDWNRNLSLTVRAPVADAKEFLKSLPRKLPSRSQQWALTLQAGASLVAPHATLNHVHLYVDVPTTILLERFAADLNWPPDPDGRVTLMRPYYRDSVWKDVRKHSGVPVVDDLQLALDLWNYPLRGREQAEHILRRSLPWIVEDRG